MSLEYERFKELMDFDEYALSEKVRLIFILGRRHLKVRAFIQMFVAFLLLGWTWVVGGTDSLGWAIIQAVLIGAWVLAAWYSLRRARLLGLVIKGRGIPIEGGGHQFLVLRPQADGMWRATHVCKPAFWELPTVLFTSWSCGKSGEEALKKELEALGDEG